jgi:hypothetical protein
MLTAEKLRRSKKMDHRLHPNPTALDQLGLGIKYSTDISKGSVPTDNHDASE